MNQKLFKHFLFYNFPGSPALNNNGIEGKAISSNSTNRTIKINSSCQPFSSLTGFHLKPHNYLDLRRLTDQLNQFKLSRRCKRFHRNKVTTGDSTQKHKQKKGEKNKAVSMAEVFPFSEDLRLSSSPSSDCKVVMTPMDKARATSNKISKQLDIVLDSHRRVCSHQRTYSPPPPSRRSQPGSPPFTVISRINLVNNKSENSTMEGIFLLLKYLLNIGNSRIAFKHVNRLLRRQIGLKHPFNRGYIPNDGRLLEEVFQQILTEIVVAARKYSITSIQDVLSYLLTNLYARFAPFKGFFDVLLSENHDETVGFLCRLSYNTIDIKKLKFLLRKIETDDEKVDILDGVTVERQVEDTNTKRDDGKRIFKLLRIYCNINFAGEGFLLVFCLVGYLYFRGTTKSSI